MLFDVVQDINLSFCELEKDAAMVVADSLANKEELKTIDLNGIVVYSCFPYSQVLCSLGGTV